MKYYFSIFFLHFYFLFYGQITYTKIPLDLQLVARDKVTNLGNVIIEGNVDLNSSYSAIRVEVYRNDVLIDTEDNTLVYNDFKASFVFNVSIPSELANYSFKIYGYNSFSDVYELNKMVSNIVAGDTYIIQGQSNAVASKRNGSANGNKSDFIRVYSSGTPNIDSLLANDAWYIADGDGGSTSNGKAGQWGLKLARLLVDNLGIPIAIFNGAHSGKGISFFKAPLEYKNSQNSNYARLYYRLNKTGLKDNVRAVLWSQGESDAQSSYTSILNYKNYFKALENSWLTDFPNIEKIYIFQTKDCNCSTVAEGEMNVKEAQRQLAFENDEIEIMPTTSLYLHTDNCHFPFVNGYESFATRIHKLVLHDIYGISYTEEIKAPMIKSAEFIAPNTLVLETDAIRLKFPPSDQTTMLTRLKQDFELRNAQGALITDVVLSGNKIYFTLSSDPGPIGNVSFVGYNSNIGFTITNSSNIELICFRNFPIKNFSYSGGDNSNYPIIENTSICNSLGSVTNIAVFFPNTNASYKWLYKMTNGDWTEITNLNAGTVYSNYNTSILEIKKSTTLPVTGTLFRVVANYGIAGDFTSGEALLTVDASPISKIVTGASTLCLGDSKTLTYGSDSLGTIQWQYSISSGQENFIDIYEENGLTYTANNLEQTIWFRVMNSNGVCANVYSSAVQILVNPRSVPGFITGGNVSVCKTTNSTILSLNNSFGSIRWQKATSPTGTYSNISSATSASYTASGLTATTYFRAVLSSGVCAQQITESVSIFVDSLPVSKTISGGSTICAGESKTLSYGIGSVGAVQWQCSTSTSSADFIDINGENGLTYIANNLQQTTWFRVMNLNGVCPAVYSPPTQVVVNPKPLAGFISGGDVYVCKTSNSTILSLQNYVGEIQWQKATTLTGSYSNISSAISNTYIASGLISTTYYRAVLSNGICLSVVTEPVVINISLVAEAKIISGASPICFGESKTLTYGTGSVGAIQWQYSTTSSTTGFINIDNENGITYITNNLQETAWFRVMNSIGICSTVYCSAVQIVVNPKPVAGAITGGNVNVCKTSNSTALKLNNSVGTIQWQKASDVGGLPGTFSNITSANLTDYTASSLTTTTYFRAALSSGVCTTEATTPSIVIVDPIAVSKTIIGTSTLCAGLGETLTYGIGSVGTIQWQYSNTSSIADFIDINGENGLNYTVNNLQQTTWFRVMNTSGKCLSVYSAPFQVVVNPNTTPTFNQVAAICSGSLLTALPTTSINGIIGKWSPALNNTSTTTYTFTPTSGGCVNTTKMTIVVNQKEIPTFTPIESICSGAALPALPTTSTNGIIGTWSPALSNTVTKTYTFTPTNAVCTSNAALTVNINTTLPPTGDAIQFFNTNNPIYIKDLIVGGTNIRWYSSNENALTNTNPLESLAVVTLGNTYYAVQSLNGCVSISPLAVTASTSLENADIDFKRLYFYPNPIQNYFKLIYFETITSIQLINSMGQSVFIAHPNTLETTLNINYLPAGIYLMELRSKDKKGMIRVIKS